MNGINHQIDQLTPKALRHQEKSREKWRMIAAILMSNLFVFIATQIFTSTESSTPQKGPELLEGHDWVTLPLQNYVPLQGDQTKVSLFNEEGQMIIQAAYIAEEIGPQSFLESSPSYLLQISKQELERILPYHNQVLKAYPFKEGPTPITENKSRRRYEILF